jgi:hypothetical protein
MDNVKPLDVRRAERESDRPEWHEIEFAVAGKGYRVGWTARLGDVETTLCEVWVSETCTKGGQYRRGHYRAINCIDYRFQEVCDWARTAIHNKRHSNCH